MTDRLTPRAQLTLLLSIVAAVHLVGWGLLAATATATLTLSTGVIAYVLGLRHAFDADHITAIDNTTRKLAAEGTRATSLGFYFSLGHSTVVFVASAAIGLGFTIVGDQLADESSPLRQTGALIGGAIAGIFLLLIAAINTRVLRSLLTAYRRMRRTPDTDTTTDLNTVLARRGGLARILRPLSEKIDRPWKMYPLGVLFGLGFDTASSIALLAVAGTSAAAGANLWACLALPIIFAAGMTLGDTVDGIFMNYAYRWSDTSPLRKAHYQITVTSLSIVAAIAVAVPVLAGVAVDQLGWAVEPLTVLAGIDMENVGIALVILFAAAWATAYIAWRRSAQNLSKPAD